MRLSGTLSTTTRAQPIAVVGAGLAGLAAAALLSKAGLPVTVFERGRRPGGRAAIDHRDGFALALGAHPFHFDPEGTLRRLTERLAIELPLVDADPRACFVLQRGRLLRLPRSGLQLLLSSLFSRFGRFRLRGLARHLDGRGAPEWQALSLGAWLRERCTDSQLIDQLIALASLPALSSSAADLSATYARTLASAWLASQAAPRQIVGGLGRLTDSLVELLVQSGGKLQLGSPVTGLLLESGRVRGVNTARSSFLADTVICTQPTQELIRLAPKDSDLLQELQPRAGQEPASTIGLDLALDHRLRDDLALLYDPVEQVLLFDPSLADPSLAPPGAQLVQLLALVSRREVDSPRAVLGRREALERLADSQLPGWRQALRFRRWLRLPTTLAVRERFEQHRGTLMGPMSSTTSGVYFAGDGTSAGGALGTVALDSALRVSELILAGRA